MIVTRPETRSGSSSWISRSAATWPSYSSPWFPARTSTVGPSPFAIAAMCTNVLAQPAVFVIFGKARCPTCLPGAVTSIEHDTANRSSPGLQVASDRALGGREQALDVLVGVRVREVAALE